MTAILTRKVSAWWLVVAMLVGVPVGAVVAYALCGSCVLSILVWYLAFGSH